MLYLLLLIIGILSTSAYARPTYEKVQIAEDVDPFSVADIPIKPQSSIVITPELIKKAHSLSKAPGVIPPKERWRFAASYKATKNQLPQHIQQMLTIIEDTLLIVETVGRTPKDSILQAQNRQLKEASQKLNNLQKLANSNTCLLYLARDIAQAQQTLMLQQESIPEIILNFFRLMQPAYTES